jgi:hypothetical protein
MVPSDWDGPPEHSNLESRFYCCGYSPPRDVIITIADWPLGRSRDYCQESLLARAPTHDSNEVEKNEQRDSG